MAGELKHTHYDPYLRPHHVPGTLLDCDEAARHRVDNSEIMADWLYQPELGPLSDTGLPSHVEHCVIGGYIAVKRPGMEYRITEAVRNGDAYVVTFSNRWLTNDGWHSESWRYENGEAWRVSPNPHPGYEHWPANCPNCGY